MARRLSILPLVIIAAVLGGCASQKATGEGAAPPKPTAGTFQSVVMTTTGGLAGVHQTVTVDAHGAVTFQAATTASAQPVTTLPADDLERLKGLTRSSAFRSAKDVYGPADPKVTDQFQHELTVGYSDTKVTTRVENRDIAPSEVVQVIDLLSGVAHGSRTGP